MGGWKEGIECEFDSRVRFRERNDRLASRRATKIHVREARSLETRRKTIPRRASLRALKSPGFPPALH